MYLELIRVNIYIRKRKDDLMVFLVLWQRGLVEREINELLRGLTRENDERNKSNYIDKSKVEKRRGEKRLSKTKRLSNVKSIIYNIKNKKCK